MLIENLPPDSAFHRAMAGHSWRDAEYLLALIADRVAENTYATVRTARGSGHVRRPKPVPRPDDKDRGRIGDRGGRDTEDVVAYLDQYKPRKTG